MIPYIRLHLPFDYYFLFCCWNRINRVKIHHIRKDFKVVQFAKKKKHIINSVQTESRRRNRLILTQFRPPYV